jgi:hypothetical protein
MNTVKGDAFLIKNDGGPAVSAYEQANFKEKSAKLYTKIGVVYLRGKNYQYTVNHTKVLLKLTLTTLQFTSVLVNTIISLTVTKTLLNITESMLAKLKLAQRFC